MCQGQKPASQSGTTIGANTCPPVVSSSDTYSASTGCLWGHGVHKYLRSLPCFHQAAWFSLVTFAHFFFSCFPFHAVRISPSPSLKVPRTLIRHLKGKARNTSVCWLVDRIVRSTNTCHLQISHWLRKKTVQAVLFLFKMTAHFQLASVQCMTWCGKKLRSDYRRIGEEKSWIDVIGKSWRWFDAMDGNLWPQADKHRKRGGGELTRPWFSRGP